MKTGILLALLTAASVIAQDVTVETSKTAAAAAREEQRKLEAEQRAKKALESPVTYSGFLVDLSRAEKKTTLLSLRQPRDPKNDYRHVYLEERTNRPRGFVLFSLDF